MTYRLFAGTYAGTIHILHLDTDQITLAGGAATPGPGNPSFLAFHPRLPVLYAVNEIGTFQGGFGGAASAYAIAADGTLAWHASQPTHGADPCHLAVDPTGHWLVVANYTSGHVTTFPLGADGLPAPASQVLAHQGAGLDPARQAGPHPHHVAMLDGRVLVSDLGTDNVVAYRLDDAAGALVADGPAIATPAGGGVRRIARHPGAPWTYALNEMHATITRFRSGEPGGWRACDTVSMLPAGYAGPASGAELAIVPSGRFLHASVRGHDSIATFAIDPADGALALRGHVPSGGATPRHFEISPCGRFLVVANQDSNRVVLFRLDPEGGGIHDTGQSVEVPAPACIRFAPAP